MKKIITIVTILLFLASAASIFSQDTKQSSASDTASTSSSASSDDTPMFGLQADIFRTVRGLSTDFAQNFSSMVDYTLTPGDQFKLIVTSGVKSDGSISNNQEYDMQLQKNYMLNVPFLGNINVKGKSLSELTDYIITRIRNTLPVQYVNFTLTSPAQFNVFIYGGIAQPGYITANPLMGVIEAIAAAGGFKTGASYRKVHIYRKVQEQSSQGEQTKTIVVDISKFYQDADFNANPTLKPGDKIYVPSADIVGYISGNIVFPGYYELLQGETLQKLIDLAGGVKPDTLTSKIEVSRIQPNGTKTVISLPLSKAPELELEKGDTVVVHSTSEISDMITLEGAIFGRNFSKSGSVNVPRAAVRSDLSYYPGITLLSALDMVGGPTPLLSEKEECTLTRVSEDGEKSTIKLDVKDLWESRDKKYDVELKPGDLILLPIKTLKVFITGQVNTPGAYDYENGYTVEKYILLAGGIVDNTGDPNGIFSVDELGKKKKLKPTDEVSPGEHILVAKKILFQSDQFVQNLLITTGWVTAIIGIVNVVWDFVNRAKTAAGQ